MGRVADLFSDCDEIFSNHHAQHLAPYFQVLSLCCLLLLYVVFDRARDFHLLLPCSDLAAFALPGGTSAFWNEPTQPWAFGYLLSGAGNRDVIKQHVIVLHSFWTVCVPGIAGRRVTLLRKWRRDTPFQFGVETLLSLTPGLLCLDSQGGRKHLEV